mmetsp:Transcript_32687/g.92956  ORF Transcript_32687/g.92956 Transcript_32687/m.92956 type:complete len:388 (-) Transcript_32687:328-1491(-)
MLGMTRTHQSDGNSPTWYSFPCVSKANNGSGVLLSFPLQKGHAGSCVGRSGALGIARFVWYCDGFFAFPPAVYNVHRPVVKLCRKTRNSSSSLTWPLRRAQNISRPILIFSSEARSLPTLVKEIGGLLARRRTMAPLPSRLRRSGEDDLADSGGGGGSGGGSGGSAGASNVSAAFAAAASTESAARPTTPAFQAALSPNKSSFKVWSAASVMRGKLGCEETMPTCAGLSSPSLRTVGRFCGLRSGMRSIVQRPPLCNSKVWAGLPPVPGLSKLESSSLKIVGRRTGTRSGARSNELEARHVVLESRFVETPSLMPLNSFLRSPTSFTSCSFLVRSRWSSFTIGSRSSASRRWRGNWAAMNSYGSSGLSRITVWSNAWKNPASWCFSK